MVQRAINRMCKEKQVIAQQCRERVVDDELSVSLEVCHGWHMVTYVVFAQQVTEMRRQDKRTKTHMSLKPFPMDSLSWTTSSSSMTCASSPCTSWALDTPVRQHPQPSRSSSAAYDDRILTASDEKTPSLALQAVDERRFVFGPGPSTSTFGETGRNPVGSEGLIRRE